MRLSELVTEATEYRKIPNVFPDGDLKLTQHFDERSIERGIDMDLILDMCRRAAVQWPEFLDEIPAEHSFIINDWDDFRVALVKREKGGDRYDYIVTTARKDLRIGPNQQLIKLR